MKQNKLHTQKKYLLLAFSTTLLTFIVGIIVNFGPHFFSMNNYIYDDFFRRTYKNTKQDTSEVAIIEINDQSLNAAQERGIFWPWSRNMYGVISDYLINEAGAKAVVFDVLFTSPDIDRADSYGEENDKDFHNVMVDTNKVVLAFSTNKTNSKSTFLQTKTIKNSNEIKNIAKYESLDLPYQLFCEDNDNFGFVNIEGKNDGIIRTYQPLLQINNVVYPSLATAAYLIANDTNFPTKLNLNRRGEFYLKWYGKGGYELDNNGNLKEESTFKYYSFWYVFLNALKTKRGLKIDQNENDLFRNKVVFIGASAKGLLDQKQTPFTIKGNAYPGVEIHATAYLNLLNQEWMIRANIWYQLLIIFIIIFLWVYWSVQTKKFIKCIISLFIFFIFEKIMAIVLFKHYNIELNLIMCDSMLIIGMIVTLLLNYYLIGFKQQKVKNAFKSYLSPDLLKQIVNSNGNISVGGSHTDASALFIDIAGFTTFSEKNNVDDVVNVLNIYLKEFSDIIMKNNGFINKFLGDGLMALFGAPSNYDNHAEMAVKSAFECLQKNNELSKNYELSVRIGVNSGEMICGNMGGGQRLEYTAIGDNVNLASRLEGTNKFFDTRIMVGENTFNQLSDNFEYKAKLQYIGKFSVKGKENFISFFCYDEKPEKIHEIFKEFLTAYENNNFEKFNEILKFFEQNNIFYGPANFYINYYKASQEIGKCIRLNEK